VSQQFLQLLESVFTRLSGKQVVIVKLKWIEDYQQCAQRFIEAKAGEYSCVFQQSIN